MKRLKNAAAALLLAGLTAGCGGGPQQTAQYELEKAAPEEWQAYQAAYEGLKKAQAAVKKEAPNEWRALETALEKRDAALQKQEAAEKAALSAKTAFEQAEKAYRLARDRLARARYERHSPAQAELNAALKKYREAAAENELRQTTRQRTARELNAASKAAAQAAMAVAETAPKEAAVVRAYQADLIAAQTELERKAPYWWKAYQTAADKTELPYTKYLLAKE